MCGGDEVLAARLAREAGTLLVGLRARCQAEGVAGVEVGRLGDRQANDLILAGLRRHRPADSVLSEESADDPHRLDADRVWIIDPLDGTREFTMEGRSDWAVHVALWEANAGVGSITAAAVALPAAGRVYSAPGGVRGTAVCGRPSGPIRIVVSASRPPPWLDRLGGRMDLEVTQLGSAGVKAMTVLEGSADAYLDDGGQYEWDSAAPVGVALAAGMHVSRLDGLALRYNRDPPWLPDLIVCRPAFSGQLLAGLAGVIA